MIDDKKQHSLYKVLKYNKLWLFLGYFWVFVTILLCLIPNPPDTSAVSFGDKLVHTAGYLCLFLWFSQIYQRKNHYRPAVGLILLGIAIEIAQGFTGYRAFEVADMLANTAGVLIGWLIAASFISFTFVKLESLLKKGIFNV